MPEITDLEAIIKAEIDAIADTNFMTDAERTKLAALNNPPAFADLAGDPGDNDALAAALAAAGGAPAFADITGDPDDNAALALALQEAAGGAVPFSAITGNATDNSSLSNALSGKSDTTHNHSGTYQPADAALGAVAGAAENTLIGRAAGGVVAALGSAGIAEDTAPGAGDFALGFTAAGALAKFDVGNLGGGSGYTDEDAQDAIGEILTSTDSVTLTYSDTAPSIKADVVFGTDSVTACVGNDSRLSDARTPTSHTHGNVTNAGAIGSTANLPVITTTSGVLTTGSFGTGSNTFCQGNDVRLTESIIIPCSDETTALTAGTAKVTFRMPYAFNLTAVRASLTTAQTSGNIFRVGIKEGGSAILSTLITIDNGEKTSTTAAAAAVISDAALADDAEMTIDIDQIGDGTAKGLKVVLIGNRSS